MTMPPLYTGDPHTPPSNWVENFLRLLPQSAVRPLTFFAPYVPPFEPPPTVLDKLPESPKDRLVRVFGPTIPGTIRPWTDEEVRKYEPYMSSPDDVLIAFAKDGAKALEYDFTTRQFKVLAPLAPPPVTPQTDQFAQFMQPQGVSPDTQANLDFQKWKFNLELEQRAAESQMDYNLKLKQFEQKQTESRGVQEAKTLQGLQQRFGSPLAQAQAQRELARTPQEYALANAEVERLVKEGMAASQAAGLPESTGLVQPGQIEAFKGLMGIEQLRAQPRGQALAQYQAKEEQRLAAPGWLADIFGVAATPQAKMTTQAGTGAQEVGEDFFTPLAALRGKTPRLPTQQAFLGLPRPSQTGIMQTMGEQPFLNWWESLPMGKPDLPSPSSRPSNFPSPPRR